MVWIEKLVAVFLNTEVNLDAENICNCWKPDFSPLFFPYFSQLLQREKNDFVTKIDTPVTF